MVTLSPLESLFYEAMYISSTRMLVTSQDLLVIHLLSLYYNYCITKICYVCSLCMVKHLRRCVDILILRAFITQA